MIIRSDINLSYVRVFHASPDAPAVDIYVNGELIFKNVTFKNFTQYVQLPMGEYKIEVYPANEKSSPVLTENIQISQKQVITVAAAGNFEDLQLIPYIEGNADDLKTNESKVRVIHLSPDAPKVDVFVNNNLTFKDVGFMDATDYMKLISGTYNISVDLADTKDNVLNLMPEFKSQKVYTIYVVGNPPDLLGIQSLDGTTFVRF